MDFDLRQFLFGSGQTRGETRRNTERQVEQEQARERQQRGVPSLESLRARMSPNDPRYASTFTNSQLREQGFTPTEISQIVTRGLTNTPYPQGMGTSPRMQAQPSVPPTGPAQPVPNLAATYLLGNSYQLDRRVNSALGTANYADNPLSDIMPSVRNILDEPLVRRSMLRRGIERQTRAGLNPAIQEPLTLEQRSQARDSLESTNGRGGLRQFPIQYQGMNAVAETLPSADIVRRYQEEQRLPAEILIAPVPPREPSVVPHRQAQAERFTPYERALLDVISTTEGTYDEPNMGYNTLVGGTQVEDLSRHPRITGLTTAEGPSRAFGRYQIIPGTWEKAREQLGLGESMDPMSQDLAALRIASNIYRRSTGRDLREDLPDPARLDDILYALGKEWASFPSREQWHTQRQYSINNVAQLYTNAVRQNLQENPQTAADYLGMSYIRQPRSR